MTELSQVERVVRILQRLSLRGQVSIGELFAYFEHQVPKRTLQRDLIALSSANIPLATRKGHGKELIWYLDRSLLRFIPETIGNQELLASYFLERLAVVTRGTQLERSIQSLLKKTRQLISPEIFASLEGPEPSRGLFGATYTGYIDYGPHSETLECVLNAASRHHRCEFHYKRPGSDPPSAFEADPYMIVFHKGALYVVARVPIHDAYILLAVQRIIRVRSTETRFVRDKSFSLETLRKHRFGIFGHPTLKPQKVVLRFYPDIAETVAERIWHPTQKIKRHRDGSLTLSIDVVISDELKAWVASWMDYVRVMSPAELANAIAKRT